MMQKRLELHEKLCKILGSRNVYFQPPSSVQMKYPAIVYSRDGINNQFANNKVYRNSTVYQIIVIDKDPDSPIVGEVSKLPTAEYIRSYTSDNLNHDVLRLHY